MNRARALLELRRAIIEELYIERWREVWFFPEYDGVKGWSGIEPIMFVGLNPSTGRFPSKADRLFYRALKRNGLADAHITDLLKIRADAASVRDVFRNTELIRTHKEWLMREVNLLQPRLIVALGHRTLMELKEWLPQRWRSRIAKIHHYSWAKRWRGEKVFGEDMASIRTRYRDAQKR